MTLVFFSDDLCIFWAFFCQEAGEERYVLDAIIGEGMKSTEGGIGVENLQGSGLIAGETSRAYQDARGSRVAESFHLLHFEFAFLDLANSCQFTIPYAPCHPFSPSHIRHVSSLLHCFWPQLLNVSYSFTPTGQETPRNSGRCCKNRTPSPSLTSPDALLASVRT